MCQPRMVKRNVHTDLYPGSNNIAQQLADWLAFGLPINISQRNVNRADCTSRCLLLIGCPCWRTKGGNREDLQLFPDDHRLCGVASNQSGRGHCVDHLENFWCPPTGLGGGRCSLAPPKEARIGFNTHQAAVIPVGIVAVSESSTDDVRGN